MNGQTIIGKNPRVQKPKSEQNKKEPNKYKKTKILKTRSVNKTCKLTRNECYAPISNRFELLSENDGFNTETGQSSLTYAAQHTMLLDSTDDNPKQSNSALIWPFSPIQKVPKVMGNTNINPMEYLNMAFLEDPTQDGTDKSMNEIKPILITESNSAPIWPFSPIQKMPKELGNMKRNPVDYLNIAFLEDPTLDEGTSQNKFAILVKHL